MISDTEIEKEATDEAETVEEDQMTALESSNEIGRVRIKNTAHVPKNSSMPMTTPKKSKGKLAGRQKRKRAIVFSDSDISEVNPGIHNHN